MEVAPGGLVAALRDLAELVVLFYATSFLFVVVVLGAIARAAGFSLFKLLRYLRAELVLVLGTASSEAALPSLMDKFVIFFNVDKYTLK